MNENKIKGLVTELSVQTYLTSLGYNVSVPLGEDCRYDLILDVDGELRKIQVKTCSEKNNGIEFSIKSVRINSTGYYTQTYSKDQIDYFATFYKDKCYLVPVEICGTSKKTLSFQQSTANTKVSLLDDYEAEKVILKILNEQEDFVDDNDQHKVYQYDLQNNFIAAYDTYINAAKAVGKKSGNHISQCTKGIRHTAYGYKWSSEKI